MFIKELTLSEFNTFANNNIIGNFYQSINYAMLKAEEGYEYEYIGLVDNTDIVGAALILYKKNPWGLRYTVCLSFAVSLKALYQKALCVFRNLSGYFCL